MKLNQAKARKQLANDRMTKCWECGRNNLDHSYAEFFQCGSAYIARNSGFSLADLEGK